MRDNENILVIILWSEIKSKDISEAPNAFLKLFVLIALYQLPN